MRRRLSWLNATALTFGFAFLYLPILILVAYSFNASQLVTVWGGFSTKLYAALKRNDALRDAAFGTIRIALLSAAAATVLGTLAADALVRYRRFRGRALFTGMVYAPMVMPEVITGLSLLLLFVALGLDRGFWTVTLAHVTFTMCFVTVVVQGLVAHQRRIPSGREAAPHRDELRGVERVRNQDEDRQVQEREAERQRGRVEPGQAPPHGGASNRCASSSR